MYLLLHGVNKYMKIYICENCSKETTEKFGSGRFCSLSCSRSFIAKQRHKAGKLKKHLAEMHEANKRKIPWKCDICGKVFSTRAELSNHRINEHHTVGGPGALKGKTKEISDVCKKISTTLKAKYAAGEIIHPLKGKQLTVEHREKISASRIKTLDSNLKCGRRLDVGWYKVKNLNGVEYTVRGHWEENVANKLNSIGVIWERGKVLKYKKDIIRRYTPDFYLPTLNAFIEVKGYYPEEDKLKMKLVLDYNPDIKVYFLGSLNYNDFLKNGILKSEFIM